jgi:6-phosphogluconolactonase
VRGDGSGVSDPVEAHAARDFGFAGREFSAGGRIKRLPGRRKLMSLNKIKKISRVATVAAGSLAMVFGLASCSLDYVVGYVYMTTNKSNPGLIDQYSIDYQSGALTLIGTPVPAGNNPVKLVAAPNGRFVYVINQGDSTVQEFAVQGDGTLTSKNTYPTGNKPTALAIDPQGKYLYVAFSFTTGTTGTGGVSIFPVNSDNSLGASVTQPVGNNPIGIVVSNFNHFVYVADQETAQTGLLLGFAQNTSTGALTPVPGTTITVSGGKTTATGFPAGVVPSAITEDLTARFVYVTDQAANQLIGYTVTSTGGLLPMVNGPFQTGLFPSSISTDPTGKLLYVTNYNGPSIEGYMIDSATGTPSAAVGAFATGVGAGPTCVAIDPALGTFLYVSNSLDNTVTGERLDPHTGGLSGVQNSPFVASGQPTCLVAVPNGAHASQVITPQG